MPTELYSSIQGRQSFPYFFRTNPKTMIPNAAEISGITFSSSLPPYPDTGPLPQPYRLGGYFNELIIIDIGDAVLKAHFNGRGEDDRLVTA